MIYLDYAADTPVREEVLAAFSEASKHFMANPNAGHTLGRQAKRAIKECSEQIAQLLNIKSEEIIYTSGATESNNLAIKGIAGAYKRYGKHIITTYLEHSSVTGPMQTLQQQGYEVDFVDLLPNGQIDLEHLKELVREDTILVSICYVDSELGIKQNLEPIKSYLAEYPHCYLHVDATQAVGKIPVSLQGIDLVTFAPHKFNGLHGIGVLVKKEGIHLESIIHGGVSTTTYRSGTPTLALIMSTREALMLAEAERQVHYNQISYLNKSLREALSVYKDIQLNSPEDSIPHILNLSLKGIKATAFQAALEAHEIYVSTKSACTVQNTPSRGVYALTKDRKRALATLRISLSYLTTEEEIKQFIDCFKKCYDELK